MVFDLGRLHMVGVGNLNN